MSYLTNLLVGLFILLMVAVVLGTGLVTFGLYLKRFLDAIPN